LGGWKEKIKHKTMNIKTIAGFLLGSSLASTHLDAGQVCKEPKETNKCAGNQQEYPHNHCIRITATEEKNKDCSGADSRKQCVTSTRTVGVTQYFFESLNTEGKPVQANEQPVTCGPNELKPSQATTVVCRNAISGSDCDSTGTGR
jgi:carboxypeptidase C (cathepsin A)